MGFRCHIEWLTKSSVMYDFLKNNSGNHLRGGRLYEIQAIKILEKSYKVSVNPDFIKRTNIFNYFFSLHKNKIQGDICVLDPYIVALGKFDTKRKNIAIIHHIDETILNKNKISKLFYRRLLKNLKKMDEVIVVSKVWKDFLVKKGIENVQVIYNAFHVPDYSFTDEQISLFKLKYGLEINKPIVYIGTLTSGKGTDSVLNIIDRNKYHVVATSKKIYDCDVQTFYFEEKEFPVFLASCDIVICMSTMPEGWNRIAHEALLTRTPVIGSGSGGMKELLEKSGQIIVTDLNNLNDKIEGCLKNSDEYTVKGYNFTSKLDIHYFKSCWENLIEEVIC